MNFFLRNILLLHILLLVIGFSWIHGGTRPELLLPVIPWQVIRSTAAAASRCPPARRCPAIPAIICMQLSWAFCIRSAARP